MRIALATSSYAPFFGGVEEHVRHVAAELRSRGHDVEVWTIRRADENVPSVVDGCVVRALRAPLPRRDVAALVRTAPAAIAAGLAWRRAARAFRPDVVHVQCFGPNGLYAAALARVRRIPLVVSTHGETFMDATGAFESSGVMRRGMKAVLRRADAVTACSRYVADDLVMRFGWRRTRVVPNGVDPQEPGLDAGVPWSAWGAGDPVVGSARRVLAVGRIERVKGFDLLVDAFLSADLPPHTHLVLGGDGPRRAELAEAVARAGAQDRVHLPGRLSRAEVVSAMADADVVVVPSRVEAFGIAVLEGMRAAKPVVATSRGGPAELVSDGESGLLVDPEDVGALSRALESVLSDPALAARLGVAARARAADFTWHRVVDEYEDVYRAVTATRPSR